MYTYIHTHTHTYIHTHTHIHTYIHTTWARASATEAAAHVHTARAGAPILATLDTITTLDIIGFRCIYSRTAYAHVHAKMQCCACVASISARTLSSATVDIIRCTCMHSSRTAYARTHARTHAHTHTHTHTCLIRTHVSNRLFCL
jgi:hypothetical protein